MSLPQRSREASVQNVHRLGDCPGPDLQKPSFEILKQESNLPVGAVPSAQRGWTPSVQVGLQPFLQV